MIAIIDYGMGNLHSVENALHHLNAACIITNQAAQIQQADKLVLPGVENIKLYSLPSTGGSGIYWYMIGGMVLMSAAAWILYKNKCREVLGK